MGLPVRISAATHDDHEWCAQLMASIEPWLTLCRDLEACRQALARPGTELFVARVLNGKPVGFVLLAPYGLAGSPYIAAIAVTPGARGKGVGERLLDFAEQQFHDRKSLFLLVSSFNLRAQQFYRGHGYEFVGELKAYIVPGHSELILQKKLS